MQALSKVPQWIRFLFTVLVGTSITFLVFAHRVQAAETILLQYRDTQLAFPLEELRTFARSDEITPALENFFATNDATPADVKKWLTTKVTPEAELPVPEPFLLIQINKTIGEARGREDLESLRTALRKSYSDDFSFTVLEILENYPQRNVRLNISRLRQMYTDVQLYVTRIEPVLQVADKILAELVCDCNVTTNPSTSSSTLNTLLADVRTESEVLLVSNHLANGSLSSAEKNLLPSTRNDRAAYENKQLVFTFGPFRPTITIGELTTFAETGELPSRWRTVMAIAKINPKDIRAALNKIVRVEAQFLNNTLTTLMGEYLLYQVGQIIETPSGDSTIQALRSSFLLSAVDDDKFSLLELMQRYPTPQVYINGIRLARLGRVVGRLSPVQGLGSAKLNLEGWVMELRTAAARAICDCTELRRTAPPALPSLTAISEQGRSPFLPTNWQPVEPHIEQRGAIKIVWLKGTPYEMGYQHGQLLKNEIATLGTDTINLVRLLSKGFGFGQLSAQRTFPDMIEECRGLAAGAQEIGLNQDVCLLAAYADVFQEMLGYNIPKELFWDGCSQFVSANAATTDGRLYHGSTVDNDGSPIPYVINNPIVFVRQPSDGLPHVFVTYPGVIWPNSGMNVAGVSLGLDTAHPNTAKELSLRGRSNVQIMAKILETATNFEDAKTIMETQPRVRANLIMIADGKSKQAGVFEFTGKSMGLRSLQPNGVLYTTNHFVLPEMYAKQPLPVDASSQSRFDRFKQLMEPGHPDSLYGKLDATAMAKVLRDRTNPYTQQVSPLTVFDDDASPGGNGSLRQAIYEPESLRFWVAAGSVPVPENPFVCFSMGELLGLPNATPCNSPSM